MNELVCEHCGVTYFRLKNGKASLRQKFCSRKCHGAADTAARGGFLGLMEAFKRVNPETGCWEWTGNLSGNGYGQMVVKRKKFLVHRVAAAQWLGLDISDSSKLVCHHCDNPICFNPEHIYVGTPADNMRDRRERGRQNVKRGEEAPQAKLSEGQVMKMREMYAEGATYDELAAWSGVNRHTCKEAVKGITWRHLPLVAAKSNQKAAIRADNKSGFKGVRAVPRSPSWAAYVYINKRQIHLGVYATPEEAARAYDAKAVELLGDKARVNFPQR